MLIPVIFLVLGSAITFVTGRLTAFNERRKAKSGFLKAIRLELLGLKEQLKASLAEVQGSIDRLKRREAAPPQLVGTLRTTVFTSQFSKLAPSDLSDATIVEIVRLYSDLPVLLQLIESVNRNSSELSKDDGSAQQAQRIAKALSIVMVMSEQFNGFLNLHRPPMIRPSISPRCTYSRSVRALSRNTSAASRRVSKRSPIGSASACDLLYFFILGLPSLRENLGAKWAQNPGFLGANRGVAGE